MRDMDAQSLVRQEDRHGAAKTEGNSLARPAVQACWPVWAKSVVSMEQRCTLNDGVGKIEC